MTDQSIMQTKLPIPHIASSILHVNFCHTDILLCRIWINMVAHTSALSSINQCLLLTLYLCKLILFFAGNMKLYVSDFFIWRESLLKYLWEPCLSDFLGEVFSSCGMAHIQHNNTVRTCAATEEWAFALPNAKNLFTNVLDDFVLQAASYLHFQTFILRSLNSQTNWVLNVTFFSLQGSSMSLH